MIVILGVIIGAWGIRFWWHGLAVVMALSIVLSIIGTAGAMNDPLVQASGYAITPGSVALALARQFLILMLGYGIGAGGRWLVRRFSRSGGA